MGAVVVWWVCVVVWGQSERNGMLLLRRGRPHQFITAAAAERSRNRAGNRRHRGGREGKGPGGREISADVTTRLRPSIGGGGGLESKEPPPIRRREGRTDEAGRDDGWMISSSLGWEGDRTSTASKQALARFLLVWAAGPRHPQFFPSWAALIVLCYSKREFFFLL
jgi:hypothetical protein